MKKFRITLLTLLTLGLLAACSQAPQIEYGVDEDGRYEVLGPDSEGVVEFDENLGTQATTYGHQLEFDVKLRRYSNSSYKAVLTIKEEGQDNVYGNNVRVSLENESTGQGNTSVRKSFNYKNGSAPSTIEVKTARKSITKGYRGYLRICATAEGRVGSSDVSGSQSDRDSYTFDQETCFVLRQ